MADELHLRLQGGPEAAAVARRQLSPLGSVLDPELLETLHLLVTELVSNAVRHAAAETISVAVAVDPRRVLTEVTNAGIGFQHDRRRRPRDDHTGFGLLLVERLARDWGVDGGPNATRVWFELTRT